MKDQREDRDPLRQALQAADPALGDPGVSRHEAARMKQLIVREAESASRPAWLPIAAGAALAALSIAALLFVRLPDKRADPTPGTARPDTASGAPRGDGPRTVRRIHFTTRGGTRVIWTLDPDFDVGERPDAATDRL